MHNTDIVANMQLLLASVAILFDSHILLHYNSTICLTEMTQYTVSLCSSSFHVIYL